MRKESLFHPRLPRFDLAIVFSLIGPKTFPEAFEEKWDDDWVLRRKEAYALRRGLVEERK